MAGPSPEEEGRTVRIRRRATTPPRVGHFPLSGPLDAQLDAIEANGAEDCHEGMANRAGAMVDHCFVALDDAGARALLRWLSLRLAVGAPLWVVEPNGARPAAILRGLRGGGEGAGTVRTATELRRLLEVQGFGIEAAWALPTAGAGGMIRDRAAALLGARVMLIRALFVALPQEAGVKPMVRALADARAKASGSDRMQS